MQHGEYSQYFVITINGKQSLTIVQYKRKGKKEGAGSAGVQPQLIQGIRRRDGVGEGQGTTA